MSRDLLVEFLDLLHISGTVRARNFKLWHKYWSPEALTKMQD